MAIVNLTPDQGAPPGQLCAGRDNYFVETEDALTYQWQLISAPRGTDFDNIVPGSADIEDKTRDKFIIIRPNVSGEYCFNTRLGRLA